MKHVLVIRLSALGDVAILAPVLRLAVSRRPDVHYTVAGPPLLAPLFAGIERVDYLGVAKRQGTMAMMRRLRSVSVDEVADMHGVLRVRRALLLLRLDALLHGRWLKVRRLRKGRLSRWLFIHGVSRKPRRQQWRRYADVLGVAADAAPSITSAPSPSTPPTVGVAPFAQHGGKVWPWEYVCELVRMLAAAGYRVLLFGSADEAHRLERLAASTPGVESTAGRHPFAEELDLIGSLSLMVSMDSANMHFASALGIPVVSIWGATHPDFGFYGFNQDPANALCANLPCQPCSAYGQRPCRHGDLRCMHAVTPAMVFERISKLVAGSR